MPRQARVVIANIPYHIIHRGNNRQAIFFGENDYKFFLEVMKEAKEKHPNKIYAYVLMSNHVHLLLEPKKRENLHQFIKLLAAKYTGYVNRIYQRTGVLWEGRFRSSPVGGERYFLACLRYIEMNPLRAGMAKELEEYPWSSYRFRAHGENSKILDYDVWYEALAEEALVRQKRYRKFFQETVLESEWKLIREMANRGGITGSQKFSEKIEKILGRKIILRPIGRPKIKK